MQSTDSTQMGQADLRLSRVWYSMGTLMLLAVAVLSLIPVPDVEVGDKLSHTLTYLVLACWFGLLASNRVALYWTIAGLFAYGALIELLQGMTGYRYAEWGDLLANGIGIGTGALFYFSPLARLLKFVDSRLASFFS